MKASETDRPQAAALWLLAAVLVGYAVQLKNGALHPEAIHLLVAGLVLALMATAAPAWPRLHLWAEPIAVAIAGAGLAFQIGKLLKSEPGIALELSGPKDFAPFFTYLAAATVLAAGGLGARPWLPRLRVPLLLAVYFLLGMWLIRSSPDPFIDVYMFQKEGVAAFLSGKNPYALSYPDIYGDPSLYGAGLSVDGYLKFGLPYPPLSLFLAIPGQLLAGDYRYGQLAAITLSAGMMAYARPGRLGAAAAAVLLFTPRGLFVLEQGWTEPYVLLMLCATIFCAARFPRAVPYVLGLLLVTKQYLVLAVPIAFFLLPRPLPAKRELAIWVAKALATGAAVTLPMALWRPGPFWNAVVALQLFQPFRVDALSFPAWMVSKGASPPSALWAFVVAAAMIALCLWRAPRTPSGFAGSLALILFAFFAFNKQAFCNYYYLVIGALCAAAALLETPERTPEPRAEESAS